MPKPCRWWTGGVDSCIAIFFLFGSRDRRNMSTGLGLPGQGHMVLVTLYWKHRFVFLIYLSMTSVSNYIWSKNTETKVQFQFRCLSIQRLINWLIVSHLNLLIRYQLIICQENLKQGLTNNIYENHDSFYQQQKVPSRSCLINSLSRGYRAAQYDQNCKIIRATQLWPLARRQHRTWAVRSGTAPLSVSLNRSAL